MAHPHLRGMTTAKMKDCFIEIKRKVLKLYKDGEDLEIERLKQSENMVLQHLIITVISGETVKLSGFAS